MRMLSLGGGVGMGIEDVCLFFVFLDRGAMKEFVETGLEIGGEAEAAQRAAEQEGITPDISENLDSVRARVVVLQLTKAGLAAQATLHGTRYVVGEELN